MKKITILIPCRNEEKGLAEVLDNVPYDLLKRHGFSAEVIVIDNNSKDKTADVARSRRVMVLYEKKKGKGNAIKTGFTAVSRDTDYVIMLDGDNTYTPLEILRMIEPLDTNFCDVVVGSRLGGKLYLNSFKFRNRVANWGYTFLVRVCYRVNTTDVLSGYYAWKKEVIDHLLPHLESDGFSIEMEMLTKMVRLGYSIYSVPITYKPRIGQSKLVSIEDGMKILLTFGQNLFWMPKRKTENREAKFISHPQ